MGDWSASDTGLGDYGGEMDWSADPAPEPAPSDWNFDLGDNVGSRETNDRQDVIKVETLLGNNGYLDLNRTDGPTGYWGSRTEDAVREYQKDNDLTVDGWLAPGGETLSSLQSDLGDFLSRAKPATPEQVDDHHERIAHGEDGTLRTLRHDFELGPRHDLPELSVESEASNHRLAQAINRSGDFGQIPDYMAEAVQQDGDKAVAEIHDVFQRIGPERAQDLAQAVVEKLPPEHHEAFIGGPVSERQPLGVGYDMLHKPSAEDIKANPELAGGLGGEIAGMKRDEEEAKHAEKDDAATDHLTGGAGHDALNGGSGDDKLDSEGKGKALVRSDINKFMEENKGKFPGDTKDDRQCVALVKKAFPELGSTDKWKPGEAIKGPGEPKLEPGTAIATFDKDGKYNGHAAIFLGWDDKTSPPTMTVFDQWAERPATTNREATPWKEPGERPIRSNGRGPQNRYGDYSVIQTPK